MVIIGGLTDVTFGSACVTSVQWTYQPNQQLAFCLGEWEPDKDKTLYKPEYQIQLSMYAPGPTFNTKASAACTTTKGMPFSLDTGVCGPGTAVKISNAEVFPTSFSYTKDTMDSFGTESWSLTQFLGTGVGGITALKLPSHILKGIAMGTKVGDSSGINMPESLVKATQGSVQAGQMGKADSVDHGVVEEVGGGSNANTYMGQGSAQMPYMVLYLQ